MSVSRSSPFSNIFTSFMLCGGMIRDYDHRYPMASEGRREAIEYLAMQATMPLLSGTDDRPAPAAVEAAASYGSLGPYVWSWSSSMSLNSELSEVHQESHRIAVTSSLYILHNTRCVMEPAYESRISCRVELGGGKPTPRTFIDR